jgi:hypothetical protein
VALLARRLLIDLEDSVDDRFERVKDRGKLPALAGPGRFRLSEDLTDFALGVVKGAGELIDAHARAVREPDFGIWSTVTILCLLAAGT